MLRTKLTALILLCALLLGGCSQSQPQATVSFPAKPEPNYETTAVTLGTFTLTVDATASFVYPDLKVLECEYTNAIVTEAISFSKGAAIKKGDIIATFRFEASEAELEQMELDLYQANRSAALQIESYESRINQYTIAAQAGGTNGEIAALQLKRTQNELALYKEQSFASLQKQTQALEEYRELFTEKTLVAPEDGIITELVSIKEDTVLQEGHVILNYTPGTSRLLKLINVPEEYRQGATPGMKVTISRANQVLEGVIAAAPIGIDEKLDNDAVYISSDAIMELEERTYFTISCTLLELHNMLLLDSKAVEQEENTTYVMVLKDGQAVKQEILCGIDNGKTVCVLDGLSEGDLVITNY